MDTDQLELEPKFSGLQNGASVSTLAEVIIRCPGYNVCRTAIFQQLFATAAELRPDVSTFTVLEGQFLTGGRLPLISITEGSHLLQHQGLNISDFSRVIEVCAGIGVVSTCLQHCHASPACFVEQNEKFAQWLTSKKAAPVVHGDIANPCTIKAVSDFTEGCPMPINGGVSCQPFSALGDRREAADPRSQSLPAMLRMGFFLRSPLLTIECTKEAHESTWVQNLLQTFAKQTGYVLHQKVLTLHNTWPAHRTRWWAVLSLPHLGVSGIPDMPQLDFVPAVMHLMQIQPHLPVDECAQLNLSAYELHHFHAQPQGISSSVIDTAKAMPTATHSWGSQLGPCHCGCRSQGFSMARLAKKGLYGVLVPLGTMVKDGSDWYHGMRHPHPKEVAILNALDPRYLDGAQHVSLRFLLAGVGQMASPIQGAWVYSNIMFQLQSNGFPVIAAPPRHVIANMCRALFDARIVAWPSFAHNRSTVLFEREISRLDHPITKLGQEDIDMFVREQLMRHHAQLCQLQPQVYSEHDSHAENNVTDAENMHVGNQRHAPTYHMPGEPLQRTGFLRPDEGSHITDDEEVETPCLLPLFHMDTKADLGDTTSPTMHFDQHVTGVNLGESCIHVGTVDCHELDQSALDDKTSNCMTDAHVEHTIEVVEGTTTLSGTKQATDSTSRSNQIASVASVPAVASDRASIRLDHLIPVHPTSSPEDSTHKEPESTRSVQLPALPGDIDPGQARKVHAQIFKDCSPQASRVVPLPSVSSSHPSAGFLAPGMTATPGHQNADQRHDKCGSKIKPTEVHNYDSKPDKIQPACPGPDSMDTSHGMLSTNDSKRSNDDAHTGDLHNGSHFPHCHAGDFAPGMPATPGYQNAELQNLVPQTACVVPGTLRADDKSQANTRESPGTDAGAHAPGIPATPGYHNAGRITAQGTSSSAVPSEQLRGPDPLMTNDPWKLARTNPDCSRPPPTPDLHQTDVPRPTYHTSGGLNQFANKKRPSLSHEDRPTKRQILEQTSQSCSNATGGDVPLQPEQLAMSLPSDEGSTPDDKFQVWVGHDNERLHQVTVTRGTTVGQLAIAENKFLELPAPIRTMTAMGSLLPVYTVLQPNQIVLIEQGSNSHLPKYPTTEGRSRVDILWNQQGWVATDEMTFYLKMIGKPNLTNTTPPLVFDDTDNDSQKFAEWLNLGIDFKSASSDPITVYTACLSGTHWFPIAACFSEESISLTTTMPDLPMVRKWAEEALGEAFQYHYVIPREAFPADCGFQAFAWIMSRALGDSRACPMDVDEAIRWRAIFAQHLHNTKQALTMEVHEKFGGMMDSHLSELIALLQSHGVTQERSPSLANHLVQSLGTAAVKQALGSARPWSDLKNRASSHQPPIKLVLYEELQQQIASRLQSGKPLGTKKNKQSRKAPQATWVAPQAAQIQIPDGIFQQQDGTPLKQITMHQMQNQQRGLVVANIQEAAPFFRAQKPLCAEGAGLFVLDFQDPTLPENHQIIRFPASCAGTQEPMIITAALIQMGQQPVMRALPTDPTTIDQVDTAVIRAVLYRDQATLAWQTLSQKPVKALLELEHLACLNKGDILDVWDRQTLNKQFQKVKHDEADMFSVVLRIQATCLPQLMESNGKDGVFLEPRTQNGRGPSQQHRVVWLPKQSFHDALFAKQATQHETFIARSGDRFGLRTAAEHVMEVHQQHRPEVAYLDGSSTKAFKVAPLPFGTTKQSLQKVFDTWEWSARPSHTQGLTPDKGGLVWIAHATEQPAFFIYTMQHGDVLISEIQPSKPVTKTSEGVPVASTRTLKHCNAFCPARN